MARALRRACRDRGLPVTGHAALRTTPLALRRLGQGSPAACGEGGGPHRRAPECLAARQTASHHAALTPRPPDGRLTPTQRLPQRYQFVTDLAVALPCGTFVLVIPTGLIWLIG